MSSYIGQVKIGNVNYPVGSMLYGTCDTEAATAAKVVAMDSYDTLSDGVTVHVKFTNSNTASSPTLKVGSTAAKSIMRYGSTAAGNNAATSWAAGAVVAFTYDGENWVENTAVDSNTTYTPMQAGDWPNGTTARLISGTTLSNNIDSKSNALDVTVTGAGAGKTLATLTETDGKIAATFQNISITKSQVSDLGTIGAAAAKGVDTSISAGSTSANLPTSAAVAGYVDGAVAGLTGAMHLIGTTTTALTDGTTTAAVTVDGNVVTPAAGDVVLYSGKEFVWTGTAWELLGDEGSYALKTSTASIGSASGWSAGSTPTLSKSSVSIPNITSVGSAPSLTKSDVSIPNVTSAGSATTAGVASGTLTITNGSAPTLGTAISATKISAWDAGSAPTLGSALTAHYINQWSAGTAPSLTVTSKTVVVP